MRNWWVLWWIENIDNSVEDENHKFYCNWSLLLCEFYPAMCSSPEERNKEKWYCGFPGLIKEILMMKVGKVIGSVNVLREDIEFRLVREGNEIRKG